VPVGFATQSPCRLLQLVEFRHRRPQRVFPVRSLVVDQPDRQLDHFFLLERRAGHIHDHVAQALLATVGRGREFEDEARIETREKIERCLAVGFVPFVHHHQRTQQAEDIVEALPHDHLVTAEVIFIHRHAVEIGHGFQHRLVPRPVVHLREKARVAPAVLEELSLVLGVFPDRARLQHDEHHAQVRLGIFTGEGIVLPQQLDLAAARAFEALPVAALAIGKRLPRLAEDRIRRDHPQHEPRLLLGVEREQRFERRAAEERFAAARRHLHAEIGNRPPQPVGAGDVARRHERIVVLPHRRQLSVLRQRIPCRQTPIRPGDGFAFAALKRDELIRFRALGGESREHPLQLVEHRLLIVLQLHVRGADSPRMRWIA